MSNSWLGPEWVFRGKTVWKLVAELLSFENLDLNVVMSLDCGETIEPARLKIGQVFVNDEMSIRSMLNFLRLNCDDPNIEVQLVSQDGVTLLPISILGKRGGVCVLRYCGDGL